jgi:hypothetical protein
MPQYRITPAFTVTNDDGSTYEDTDRYEITTYEDTEGLDGKPVPVLTSKQFESLDRLRNHLVIVQHQLDILQEDYDKTKFLVDQIDHSGGKSLLVKRQDNLKKK